jgi:hypothetical protein
MDPSRFDDLLRALSTHRSRRGVLGLLGALTGLGMAGGGATARPRSRRPSVGAEACRTLTQSCTKKRPGIGRWRRCCAGLVCRNTQCRIKECSGFLGCGEGRGCCEGKCVDLRTDPSNCGQCGKACGSSPCLGGRCLSTCVEGLTACDGACVDLLRDPKHCGACGVTCGGTTPRCIDGQCRCREQGEACPSSQESLSCCGADRGWLSCSSVDERKLNQFTCPQSDTGLQCCLVDGQPCADHCDCCGSSFCSSRTGTCTDGDSPSPRCTELGETCGGYRSTECCGFPDTQCCAFARCDDDAPYQGPGYCRRVCRQLGETCNDGSGGPQTQCCAPFRCNDGICDRS